MFTKNTKRVATLLIAALSLLTLLVGCDVRASKSFTFNVDTGDTIEVSLDTTDAYDLSSDLPFAISCDGEKLTQGTFVDGEVYEQYVRNVEHDANAELLDSGKKDGNEYIFWCYDDEEYNYLVLVADSDTCVLLGNITSERSAKKCFERLTISVAD